MLKKGLLIAFLLVGFSSFSQTATKDSVVVLTEKQARAVAKDLVEFDALKKIAALQGERINNFQQKEKLFGEQLSIKDTIISKQSAIIDKQNAVISNTHKMHIHGYAGFKTASFDFTQPSVHGNVVLEYKKWIAGAIYTVKQNAPATMGILVEYKLF